MKKQELRTLADYSQVHCVSIYLPTHKKGKEVNEGQDAIVLKNHYQRIRQQLENKDISESEANEYLAPIRQLIDDGDFWRHQEHGLAVFRGKDYFEYMKLPYRVDEFSSLSTSFHLGQLIPMLNERHPFYILAVSLNRIRLMEGDEQEIQELDVQGMLPDGMDDALSYYDFEKTLQYHSGSNRGEPGSPIYHGQGGDGDMDQTYIKEYFRRVDEVLNQMSLNRNQPVVLTAVDYLHPIYHDANKVLKLTEDGIKMNPDHESPESLHVKATELLSDHFNEDKKEEMRRYAAMAGSGKASYDINEIAPAAINGRVEALFFAKGTNRWGYIDRSTNSVTLHDDPQENDQDLVSKSAVQTILNGGRAYAVDREDLPEQFVEAELAAIFRW